MKKIILLLIALLTLTACDVIKDTAEDFKNSDTGEVTTDDISDAFGSLLDKFTDEEFGLDEIKPLLGTTLQDNEVLKYWNIYSEKELNLNYKDILDDETSGDSFEDIKNFFDKTITMSINELKENKAYSFHFGEDENIRLTYYFTKNDELYLSSFHIDPIEVDHSRLIEDKFMFSDIYRLKKIVESDNKPQLIAASNFNVLDTEVYTLFLPELKEGKIILNELTHNPYGIPAFHFVEDITDLKLDPLNIINNNYLKTIKLRENKLTP